MKGAELSYQGETEYKYTGIHNCMHGVCGQIKDKLIIVCIILQRLPFLDE